MIVPTSKRFLKRFFEKTRYRFQDRPDAVVNGPFGLYVHVPFCQALCNFCPFYKEQYNFSQCNSYVDAVVHEIQNSQINGESDWLYFGGGTPNMLTAHQLAQIKDAIQSRVNVKEVGIELLPDVLSAEYIKELRIAKFTKASLGVGSLQQEVLRGTGRAVPGREKIAELVREIKYRGLWLNLDFIIGLPGQNGNSFLTDVKNAAGMEPDQVTIYPIMQFGDIRVEASMPGKEQYSIIEEAGQILKKAGYGRTGIWTFSRGDNVYDLPRDELVQDYFGFGPSAHSRYGQWSVVNPEVGVYLDDWKSGKSRGFVTGNTQEADDWRRFASKLYDMDFSDSGEFVKEQRKVVNLLKKSGFINKNGQLTEKGLLYAHDITKIIMENISYPFRNPGSVENYDDYASSGGLL